MTNAMIILNESVKLMEDGIIKGTGQFVEIENEDGSKKRLELPEELHTFAAWKNLGYVVKKGEKAIAKFPIWKYASKTELDENNEETEKSKMFMKVAAFFTKSQVERMV